LALKVSARAQCQWIFVLQNVGRFSDALRAGEMLLAEVAEWKNSSDIEQLDIGTMARSYVGRVRENRGEQDQALGLFEASREIREKLCAREPDNLAHQRDLGIALNNVGRGSEKRGEQYQALGLFEASREISEKLCAREPDNLAHQRELGIALYYCGAANWKLRRNKTALERLQAAHRLFESLCQTASFYDSQSNLQVVRQLIDVVTP
ncbi:MAG: hypothetical protein ACKOU6_14885, partial [Planctomycetota bacterium]